MISKIKDSYEEVDCKINIKFRSDKWGPNNEFWGVQVDNSITPIYCCNCENQLDSFYRLQGGRYGYVGIVECDCGAEVHCYDSDNIVEYLETMTSFAGKLVGKYYIDYKQLYKLDNFYFSKIKIHFKFDLFSEFSGQTVDLKYIIDRLESDFNYKATLNKSYSADKFNKLPFIINKWFAILNSIENTSTTNSTLPKSGRKWWQKFFGSK